MHLHYQWTFSLKTELSQIVHPFTLFSELQLS